MVQSMRGDLDKPKTVPVNEAELPVDVDNYPICIVAQSGGPRPFKHFNGYTIFEDGSSKVSEPAHDGDSTVCPDDDDRNIDDFELLGDQADWTKDFDTELTIRASVNGMLDDCKDNFNSTAARPLLASALLNYQNNVLSLCPQSQKHDYVPA